VNRRRNVPVLIGRGTDTASRTRRSRVSRGSNEAESSDAWSDLVIVWRCAGGLAVAVYGARKVSTSGPRIEFAGRPGGLSSMD